MDLNYYAHTISTQNKFMLTDIGKLDCILKSGYLLSRRKLGFNHEFTLFNGMDYISLCDLSKNHSDYSAYNMYARNGLSLLFRKDFKVITPFIIDFNENLFNKCELMHEYGLRNERYSDLPDEVQVKDRLSLEYLAGLSISLERFLEYRNYEYLEDYSLYIKSILRKYNCDIPLVNLDDGKVLKK